MTLPQRRALMTTVLAMMQLESTTAAPPRVIADLTAWLASWNGLGVLAAGMQAQGFDLELRQFPHGWRANFYPTGTSHSIVHGSGWERTPWAAVQLAAWETLTTER